MAQIVEGSTSVNITTAKPKAVKLPQTYNPINGTTQVAVQTAAPTPVATPSASSGGVGSPNLSTVSGVRGGISSIQNQSQAVAQSMAVKNAQTLKEAQSALAGAFGTGVFENGQLSPQQIARETVNAALQQGKQATASQVVQAVQTQEIPQDFSKNPVVSAGASQGEIAVDTVQPFTGQVVSPTVVPTTGGPMPTQTESPTTVPTANVPLEQAQPQKEQVVETAPVGGGSSYVTKNGAETGVIPTAPSGSSVAFPEASAGSGNPFWDQLQTMKFTYDPLQDPEYIQGAKVIENQVAQMMVGRGGLYSSVMNNALSSKLIEFQIAMRKQAYEQFTGDRAYMMDMAQAVWDREDAEFSKYMAIQEFNANRDDEMFSRQMQQASLSLQQQNAAIARDQAKLQAEQEAAAADLNTGVSNYVYQKNKHNELLARWGRTGVADNEITAFYGLPKYGMTYAQGFGLMRKKSDWLYNEEERLTQLAASIGDYDAMQAGLYGFMQQPTTPTVERRQTYDETGTLTGETRTWTE